MAANGLKVTPSGRRVEIGAWFEGTIAVVAVRDEGPGIARDDRARIFERFYRVRAQERVPGTGLGLAIARDLARRMGGDLDVASRLAVGSAFVLVLPGPSPHVEPDVIGAAMTLALQHENDRLEALAAVRSTGSRASTSGASAATPQRRRVSVASATSG